MNKNYGFKIVNFNEVPNLLWDTWVSLMGDASYLHSSKFLAFLHEMVGTENAMSFACIQDEKHPLALCPLAITKNNFLGVEFLDASWNGAPVGIPVFADSSRGISGQLKRDVYEVFHSVLKENGVKRSYIRRHPVSLNYFSENKMLDSFQLYPLKEGYECQPQNTIIIDLRGSEEALTADLGQYQRKHIRRSEKCGMKVLEYNASTKGNREMFALYQQAHIKSVGKLARPQKSFDLMLQFINEGCARLFVAFANDVPISFIYCGEFYKLAFGWSQVNLDEFEKQYSPRHFLEWEAILSYKKRGFLFYEVGTFWAGPQLYKIPTAKELSIAEFKRRYGGIWLPELIFERIFDRELWEHIHGVRTKLFLESDYFSNPLKKI